jgi:uncharacterized protein involved in exopolysaccharide biosynthesis
MVEKEESGPLQETSPFGIADLLQILRVRWQLIASTTFIVLSIVLIITLQLTPLYTAKALVMLDQRKNNIVNVDAVISGLSSDTATLQDQVQILGSRTLAARVIQKLELEKDPAFNPPASGPGSCRALGQRLCGCLCRRPADDEIRGYRKGE